MIATATDLEKDVFRQRVIAAAVFSFIAHIVLFFFLSGARLDFGKPIINPTEPQRFHLERARIDPNALEQPPLQRDVELQPEKISAFNTPLQQPFIAPPAFNADMPTFPSAQPSEISARAISSLPLETEGNTAQLSQALAHEASTAATHQALQQGPININAGVNGDASGYPKFEEVSSLIRLKPPTTLERPSFRPILLRLSNDVLFDFDSTRIQPPALPTLQRVADFLKGVTNAKITVEGHCDTFGDEGYNQQLSEQRARSVADWLAQQSGLQRKTFFVRGYGKMRPLVSPYGTPQEQKINRRVEIRIEAER
ncbi:MAG: OmpA family protein [bacterium]